MVNLVVQDTLQATSAHKAMDMCDAFAHRHEAGVILKLAIEQVGQEIDGGARFDAVFLDDQHPILMMIDQLL